MTDSFAPPTTPPEREMTIEDLNLSSIRDIPSIRPGQLTDIAQRHILLSLITSESNLGEPQILVNPWGFPFLPEPIQGANDYERLPANLNPSFAGHPVFWLDPTISAKQDSDGDDDALRNMRLYCTLMAMGFWDPEENSWIDALADRNIDVESPEGKDQLRRYLMRENDDLAEFKLMPTDTERNEAAGMFQAHLSGCVDMTHSAIQSASLADSSLLDDAVHVFDRYENFEDGLVPGLQEVLGQVEMLGEMGDPISSLVEGLFAEISRLSMVFQSMDVLALRLTIPVIAAVSETREEAMTQVVYAEEKTGDLMDSIRSEMESHLNRIVARPEAKTNYAEFGEYVRGVHSTLHNRLGFSIENFRRMNRGQMPMASIDDWVAGRSDVLPEESLNAEAARESGTDRWM